MTDNDRKALVIRLRVEDVVKAAELFVDNTRVESMSIPFMLLVQAVDRLRASQFTPSPEGTT